MGVWKWTPGLLSTAWHYCHSLVFAHPRDPPSLPLSQSLYSRISIDISGRLLECDAHTCQLRPQDTASLIRLQKANINTLLEFYCVQPSSDISATAEDVIGKYVGFWSISLEFNTVGILLCTHIYFYSILILYLPIVVIILFKLSKMIIKFI